MVVVDATVMGVAGAVVVVVVGGVVVVAVVVVVPRVVVGDGSVVVVEVVVVAPAVVDGPVDVASRDDVVTGSLSADPSDPPHAAPSSAAERPIAMVEVRTARVAVTVGSSSVGTLPNAPGRPCSAQYVVRRTEEVVTAPSRSSNGSADALEQVGEWRRGVSDAAPRLVK